MVQSEHFSTEFHSISEIIRKRRTCKDYNGQPIAKETIEALLELAVFAPNHRLTEPWKFRVLLQAGLGRWIQFLRDELPDTELAGFEKPLEKVAKAGAVIYITHLPGTSDVITQENYAATCAAVQNILLAATAQHLQSYWSTSQLMMHSKTKEFLDIPEDEIFVGAIWLGHGDTPTPKPRKLAREKTLWIK